MQSRNGATLRSAPGGCCIYLRPSSHALGADRQPQSSQDTGLVGRFSPFLLEGHPSDGATTATACRGRSAGRLCWKIATSKKIRKGPCLAAESDPPIALLNSNSDSRCFTYQIALFGFVYYLNGKKCRRIPNKEG